MPFYGMILLRRESGTVAILRNSEADKKRLVADRKENLEQGTEAEGAAYTKRVRTVDPSCLWEDRTFTVVRPERPTR